MKKNWFDSKVKEFSLIGGYQKPPLNENSVKLDSNENYVLSKQFQNDIVSEARKNSDVRKDYGNERISVYIKNQTLLQREGADPPVSENFYCMVVQKVLLFGA